MSEDDRDGSGGNQRDEFRESSDRDGFSEATEQSAGDPRVVLIMNAVLSTVFASAVGWGLSVLGVLEFTLVNVATLAVLLFAATYAITKPGA